MGPLAWLHCRSCCDEILMLAGIVLRAWVLPEGEGVLWNLSLGQGPQLMRGLSAGGGRGSATLFY